MADVDFQQTFNRNRLVVKGEFILSRYYLLAACPLLVWFVLGWNSGIVDDLCRKIYLFFGIPVTFLVTGWVCYKRLTEFKLGRITTTWSDEENRVIINAYLQKEEWEIQDEGKHYISAISSGLRDMQATIILNGGTVLTNVIYYDRWRQQMPILFAGNELKDALEYRLLNRDNPNAEMD